MIKCNKCGCENNAGSHICLNCREIIAYKTEDSVFENQESFRSEEQKNYAGGLKIIIITAIVLAVLFIGFKIYINFLIKPVIDEDLLGTWQSSSYGYVDEYTFNDDGIMMMSRRFSNGDNFQSEMYYTTENGTIKTSHAKWVDNNVAEIYEYEFYVSGEGRLYIKLKLNGSNETKILYKVY